MSIRACPFLNRDSVRIRPLCNRACIHTCTDSAEKNIGFCARKWHNSCADYTITQDTGRSSSIARSMTIKEIYLRGSAMKRLHYGCVLVLTSLLFLPVLSPAQEFGIAVGTDTTWSGGAVYGGLNGLAAVQGDSNSQYTINFQLISGPGQFSGSRIFLNDVGVPPGAVPDFDGTNYFLVWLDFSGTLKGQLLSTAGQLIGPQITIASGVSVTRTMSYNLLYAGTDYLVAFIKNDGYLYGQYVNKSGALSGNQFPISGNLARDFSMAFDGTNVLVAWVEAIPETDKDIFGQFVSQAGTLVGSNFLIDGGPNYSDNPTWLACDGTRYLIVFHEMVPGESSWSVKGTFITLSGTVQETITICDTTKSPTNASVAFDGRNYLVTWSQRSDLSMMGRFYDPSGAPADAPFVIFFPMQNRLPIGGVGYGGGKYLAIATRLDSTFTNGDVYGRFIEPLTGVEEPSISLPTTTMLYPNYPNPFNPTTVVSGQWPVTSVVRLVVYDILGREVAVLANGMYPAGRYSFTFDAKGIASGTYFYRLTAGSFSAVRKMLLVR